MAKITSYLSQLKFDPKLLHKWPAKLIANIRVVLLIVLSIIILGSISFIQIPRRLNPEIKIPIVIVNTILPGSTAFDSEKLLTIPLEDSLKDIKGVDSMSSSSNESVSTISLQFLSTVDGEKARSDVQNAIDTVSLPEDALEPKVQLLDFEDQPFWTFILTTKADTASLMRFSKKLKDSLEEIKSVDRVLLSGFDQQYIGVTIKTTQAKQYGISPLQLSQAIQKAGISYPAGTIRNETATFSLAIDPQVSTIDDIRNIVISVKGTPVKIGDVAEVVEKSTLDGQETLYTSHKTHPTKTVQFFIYKSSTANIDAAEKDAQKVVNTTLKNHENTFTLTTISNTAREITTQFTDLFSEFRSTVILVFLLLLIFLGLKQAAIASLTIPLTFLSTFAIISALGMSLNFLTMFALLIALGLLIDDTIVAVAAMTRYHKTGRFTPYETGILVWRDFIVPLWSTTITTIWAFVPLLLSTGIIGEFIKPIPIVVTATMLSSTTISVLVTIPLMVVLLKPKVPSRVKKLLGTLLVIGFYALVIGMTPKTPLLPVVILAFSCLLAVLYYTRVALWDHIILKYKTSTKFQRAFKKGRTYLTDGIINIEILSKKYSEVIQTILESKNLRRNTLIAIIVFAVGGYLLVPLGIVKNEFFPKTNENIIYINGELPKGTSPVIMKEEMNTLLQKIRLIPEAEFVVAESGQSFGSQGERSSDASNFLFTMHLYDKQERKTTSQDLAEKLRKDYEGYPGVEVKVQELSGGPPAGADIQIKLLGADMQVLDGYGEKIIARLKKEKGIVNPQKSVKPGLGKIVFVPNQEMMTSYGITIDQVAFTLRTFASGFELDTLGTGDDRKSIVYRSDDAIASPEDLYTLTIPTSDGFSIPLSQLGSFKLSYNPTGIARENGKRTISVTAGVEKGTNIPEKNKVLETYADSLNLPEGYSWATGGVNEENNKSVQSILRAMIVAALLIVITMIIEFGSYRQALLALLLIPLSIAGVLYIFGFAGIPLSFPALIGILALFGIVVTHAIVVIEKINENRKEGLELKEAIVDAARNRLEPVLLTSLATMLGLLPITLADPLWRGLGGAIIAGLLFSGAIKLFFIPVMYYNWFKNEK